MFEFKLVLSGMAVTDTGINFQCERVWSMIVDDGIIYFKKGDGKGKQYGKIDAANLKLLKAK